MTYTVRDGRDPECLGCDSEWDIIPGNWKGNQSMQQGVSKPPGLPMMVMPSTWVHQVLVAFRLVSKLKSSWGGRMLDQAWSLFPEEEADLSTLPRSSATFSRMLCVCLLTHVWLCNPVNCSAPVSSVYGILQARILECIAICCSRASSWLRNRTPTLLSPVLAGVLFTSVPSGKPPHFPVSTHNKTKTKSFELFDQILKAISRTRNLSKDEETKKEYYSSPFKWENKQNSWFGMIKQARTSKWSEGGQ